MIYMNHCFSLPSNIHLWIQENILNFVKVIADELRIIWKIEFPKIIDENIFSQMICIIIP